MLPLYLSILLSQILFITAEDTIDITEDNLLYKLPTWGPTFNISLDLYINSFSHKGGEKVVWWHSCYGIHNVLLFHFEVVLGVNCLDLQ